MAIKYNKQNIRVSYVAPTKNFSSIEKDEYYNTAKEIFLPFIETAKKFNITILLDCNHIPLCYFNKEEKELINQVTRGNHNYCKPVVDITPDFKCTACFGAYKLFDLLDFDNILEVERYLQFKRLFPLIEANSTGKCANCKKHKNLSCQGGCLAFANKM